MIATNLCAITMMNPLFVSPISCKPVCAIATPVFDGAHEPDIVEDAGAGRSGRLWSVTLYDGRTGEAFDRPVTWAISICSSCTTWLMTRSTPVRLVHTRLLPSSRWVVRRSLVVSASVRWRSGRWKLMARLTRFRKCSPSSRMTLQAVPRSTKHRSRRRYV